MLMAEAQWVGARIESLGAKISPLLDLGSSTEAFRKRQQPWIDEHVYGAARRSGVTIVTSDVKAGSGIELVGDIGDERFVRTLAERGFQSVLCSNLLEHVHDRDAAARAIVSVLPAGGHILASGPRRYPFHADPIDTGFRPDPHEFARSFPGTELVLGEVVTDTTYLPYFAQSPLRSSARLLAPWRLVGWRTAVSALPWLFRRFEATGVVLKKL